MSIDKYIWAPSGVRAKQSITYRKYSSLDELIDAETPEGLTDSVLLAQGGDSAVDESYIFESEEDREWFWREGYKSRLCLDDQDVPVPFDLMELRIDDELVARRGQKGFDEFDTKLDHLPTGERRCDHRYKAVDPYGDAEWARCTRPATLRIRVIPAETVMATDGSGQETYTPLPAEAYEALSCADCYESGKRSAGELGNPADLAIIGEVDANKGGSHA